MIRWRALLAAASLLCTCLLAAQTVDPPKMTRDEPKKKRLDESGRKDPRVLSGKNSDTLPQLTPDPGKIPSATECDQGIEVDSKGGAIYPAGATEIEPVQTVDEDRGPLSVLYPSLDTSTDEFYPKLPCDMSIGGRLPSELENYTEPDMDESELATFESEVAKKEVSASGQIKIPALIFGKESECFLVEPSGAKKPISCDSPKLGDPSQPFNGRDIIFVHGLALEHLKLGIANNSAALKQWPGDTHEFLSSNGYFRGYAERYWERHIREHLWSVAAQNHSGWEWPVSQGGPSYVQKKNRYLLISYSSNQRLEYSQHAMLTQISNAIATNANVVTPPNYPTNVQKPFCSMGCVIISHSTGGLLTSTALSQAKSGYFGTGAINLPNRIFAHVSLAGATSGSRIATAALAMAFGAVTSAPVVAILCNVVDKNFELSCGVNLTNLRSSVLVDLIPLVAQLKWGPVIDQSPVPTLTVAGGHPFYSNTGSLFLGSLLPGVDDGVVTANSACGNPLPVQPGVLAPSGFLAASKVRVYDMGVNSGRAILSYKAMRNLKVASSPGLYFAGMCSPYLSSSGMVLPVVGLMSSTPLDARRRYRNYFSFMQGSIDHSQNGAGMAGNVWPSWAYQSASVARVYNNGYREEASAITDSGIYSSRFGSPLVNPAFSASLHEIVRGRKVRFKLFGVKRVFYLWKRTYHLPRRWETMSSAHYVYQYVGR